VWIFQWLLLNTDNSPTTLSPNSSSPSCSSPTFRSPTQKPQLPSSNVDLALSENDSAMMNGVIVGCRSAVTIVIGLFVFIKGNCHIPQYCVVPLIRLLNGNRNNSNNRGAIMTVINGPLVDIAVEAG
jgi:hypothetical protein